VTGCDANVYPPMSTQLEAQGIELIDGFGTGQINLKPDMFVIGNVVARGNPLMEEILNRNLPYVSGPQWLAQTILHDKWVLGVAARNGKTTTSAMLAWVLEYAGLNPGFLIGGVPQNFGISARLTESPFFVIEADEYDTAFFDKRSKFVHTTRAPRSSIIWNSTTPTSSPTLPRLRRIPSSGAHRAGQRPAGQQWPRGRAGSGVAARLLDTGGALRYRRGWQIDADNRVALNSETQGTLQWELLGEHNRMNALAALAAARHAGCPSHRV